MSKSKRSSTKPHNTEDSSNPPKFPKMSIMAMFDKKEISQKVSHPAELNPLYFPPELEDAKTGNRLLKKYIESKQSKYLFEAIKDDCSVLQDKIVIETIKSWREYFDPVAYISNEALGGITISEINYRDLEYLLKNVSRSLSPDLTDMYYLIECSNGSGLTHKIPINAPGRPKLELDMHAKDPDPFVCFWDIAKKAIESNRPKNQFGKKKIYRNLGSGLENESAKIRDYKKPLSDLYGKEIPEYELKYFEFRDITTITASLIAYVLKNSCHICERLCDETTKTKNHWHTVHRIYKQAKKLGLFDS